MKEISQIIKECRQPFPGSRVDWKIQTTSKTKPSALVVAFTDARDISERLNSVCPDQWSTRFAPIVQDKEIKAVECTLTVRDEKKAVSRSDVGIGDIDDEHMQAGLKTLYSDALKRAAVHFGINSCLYELPTIWLHGDEDLWIPEGTKPKGLTDAGKTKLKERYDKWVTAEPIVKRFGEVYV